MSEAPTKDSSAAADPLEEGRAALARHDWVAAHDLLSRADGETTLHGPDLEALALAAFFVARADAAREIKERAFAAYRDEGDPVRAAYLALDVARDYGNAGNHAIATAWLRRAESLLGGEGETYAHGYLALVRGEAAASAGRIDEALALAQEAVRIGTAAADADLKAYALSSLGELKIATGAAPDGLALLEEASISAVNGELSPFTTGVTACRMISACRDLTDYRRASEWIEATEKYCHRESLSGFPGVCRIHRAEVAAVGGAWDQAQQELERATTELGAFNATPPQADGFYAIGEIKRLKGDYAGADAALREAHARGRTPQPALALIRLAEGRTKAAAAAINAAVTEESWNRWARSKLLPAQVEISIAAHDLARARAATDELAEIVAAYASPSLEAARQAAAGRTLLAEGDLASAARELRAAIRAWRAVGAPHEVARTQVVLARALRGLEDDADADLELRAAIDEFRRLGARPDAEAAERELRDAEDRRSGPTQVRRTFMFTDIVGSTNLAEALGDQAWERVLRWHDDTLRAIIAGGGGEIVNSTGDGFFVAFDSAVIAIDCAIAVQRALRDHRDETGFAIAVRIGLHAAEANRRGDDYSGMGVHVAARVAALAGGGEILASAEALAEAGTVRTAPARQAAIRGVTAPVSVAAVTWT